MFSVEKKSDNRVDITIRGQINKSEMSEGLDQLIAKSMGMKKAVMLYTFSEFEIPTLGAFVIEFSRLPKVLSLASRFSKAAVVTDKEWVQNVAELEGLLIPGLTIKGFDLDEVDEAEAWLAKTD